MSTGRAHDDVLVHLRAARDHADRHFTEPLDLEQLAAVARLSKFHFQRLFSATYGLSPAAYLSRRRIERAQDLLRATNLYEFDNLVTAPLHGYRDTDDYWLRASSKPHLQDIRLPTLVINPKNDPFLPARHLPGPADVSAHVRLEQPAEGGHVGFVSGPWPGRLGWLPQRLVRFFTAAGKA